MLHMSFHSYTYSYRGIGYGNDYIDAFPFLATGIITGLQLTRTNTTCLYIS